jgi:hypothetical protein
VFPPSLDALPLPSVERGMKRSASFSLTSGSRQIAEHNRLATKGEGEGGCGALTAWATEPLDALLSAGGELQCPARGGRAELWRSGESVEAGVAEEVGLRILSLTCHADVREEDEAIPLCSLCPTAIFSHTRRSSIASKPPWPSHCPAPRCFASRGRRSGNPPLP